MTTTPKPSAFVNYAALQLDPQFNPHEFDQTAKLYSMPQAYGSVLLDWGCRQPGNYVIDMRSSVSQYTKNQEYSVAMQLVSYQQKQLTLYYGGVHAENVSVWLARFVDGTARRVLRNLLGSVCDFLDRGQAAICLDALGDLELNPLPSNTQLQAAYQIWRIEQQVNQCRVALIMLMRSMGWRVKVEAFCPPGFLASALPSISTDDVKDIPASYSPLAHEVWVTGTPDPDKLAQRLLQGRTHFIDSALFSAEGHPPAWWPSSLR